MGEESRPPSDELVEAVRRVLFEALPLGIVVRNDHEELVREIKKLLNEQLVVRCRFSEEEAGGILRMLTGGGSGRCRSGISACG